ncbi:MAG: hypothetical protein IPK99_03640 [Flavobacteriales bacterium]|nr:hypothetical protein [Flavobacteriales bacterium]
MSVNTMPDAGIDGAIALCVTSPAIDLFVQLGGSPDPGGTWSGPSPVAGGMFNTSNMNAGIYTYTVVGIAPCPTATAAVDVNVVTNPDAGLPGAITLCATDAPADLFAQLNGAPDAGGNWTGPSPVVGGQYDPANMNPGVYTYTITVPPPCVSGNSTVTVSEVQPPDAGIDDALTLCISSPAASLFASLGGSPDAGGSWTDPNGLAHSGTFNPANDPAGDYTYTVNGTAPCPSASAVVTVSVVALPDAGLPGSITLCTTDGPADLFAQLNGTPDAGGNWTGPSPVVGGQYDPAGMNPGVYTYTITVPPPCVSVNSTVTVSEVQPPDAGIDDALTLCISSPAASLFGSLGGSPDVGGSWTGPNGLAHSGTFNPANDPAGDYTYTVNGTAPCPAASAVVTVSVVALPDAGLPGSITLCTTDGPADLFAQLNGTPDAGGNWTGPSPVVGGQYDPANMSPGVYTYTITVPPPCVSVTSTVTVALSAPPNAGSDGAITLCVSSPLTGLFASLGGSPDAGGSWTDPNGNAHSGTFDPANDVIGDYTYTVSGTAPCPSHFALVTVSVVSLPDPGLPGVITWCTTDPVGDLFGELGGTPDAGGTWTHPNGDPLIGTFDPATDTPGIYSYTITVPPPCLSVTSTVAVSLSAPPDPGMDGSLTLCISSPAEDLFASLSGAPDLGGTWTDPNGSAHSGNFDPANDIVGDYTYTVSGISPCPAASAVVTVSVVSLPDPGTPGGVTWCTTDPVGDLFAQLGGTPDAGGSWTDPNGDPFSGTFDPVPMHQAPTLTR